MIFQIVRYDKRSARKMETANLLRIIKNGEDTIRHFKADVVCIDRITGKGLNNNCLLLLGEIFIPPVLKGCA